MRKFLFVLLALVVTSATRSYASDLNKSKVAVIKHDNLVRLCYESPSESPSNNNVEVSILDGAGQEIFNEEIKAQSFIRPYNFSHLDRGDYVVRVKDNSGIVHSEKIRFYDRAFISHVSKLKDQEHKFLVTIPQKGNNSVNVCVYDSENRIVYSEVVNGNTEYARIFNLKNVKGGSIEVFDQD